MQCTPASRALPYIWYIIKISSAQLTLSAPSGLPPPLQVILRPRLPQIIQELGRAPERSLSLSQSSKLSKFLGLNHYHCHNFLGFLKTQFNNSRIMKMIEKPHNWVALLHQLQPRQRVHPPKNKTLRILHDRCQIWQLVDNENIIEGVGGQNW